MAEQEPPIKKPKIIDPGLGHFPPIEETKVAVGSIISYGGTNYEINELPNAGNGQEYVLRPPGQPTAVPYTLPMALLTKVLANGEAKLLTPEIKTGAEEEKAKADSAEQVRSFIGAHPEEEITFSIERKNQKKNDIS